MSRKEQCSFALEPSQIARLREISSRTRVPQAELVRQAVDALLVRFAEQPGEWQGGFGVDSSESEGA